MCSSVCSPTVPQAMVQSHFMYLLVCFYSAFLCFFYNIQQTGTMLICIQQQQQVSIHNRAAHATSLESAMIVPDYAMRWGNYPGKLYSTSLCRMKLKIYQALPTQPIVVCRAYMKWSAHLSSFFHTTTVLMTVHLHPAQAYASRPVQYAAKWHWF